MNPSREERGAVLLGIARESLAEALGLGMATSWDDAWLYEPGATFVTLIHEGRLRGCVGTVRAHRPLFEDVRSNARAAAFQDTRFLPLTAVELPETRIEVSLLSALEALQFGSEEEATSQLTPGTDGVFLEYGGYRGTFLPQVWRQIAAPGEFLRDLKRKAGLEPDFWSAELRLWRYTVEKWSEEA